MEWAVTQAWLCVVFGLVWANLKSRYLLTGILESGCIWARILTDHLVFFSIISLEFLVFTILPDLVFIHEAMLCTLLHRTFIATFKTLTVNINNRVWNSTIRLPGHRPPLHLLFQILHLFEQQGWRIILVALQFRYFFINLY